MIVAVLFDLLLLGASLLALRYGGGAERSAAATSVLGAAATFFATASIDRRFLTFNDRLLIIDAVVAISYLVIAIRSSKFWPIWSTACQILAAAAAFVMAFPQPHSRLPNALGEQFWGWPPLLMVAAASWRCRPSRKTRARS